MGHDEGVFRDMVTYLVEGDEGTYTTIEVERPAPEVLAARRRAESDLSGRVAVPSAAIATAILAYNVLDWAKENPIAFVAMALGAVFLLVGAWRLVRSLS